MTVIEVWTDVRCPWCWIGHRQLARAVSKLGSDLQVEYKSYLLEPDGPPQPGISLRDAALSSWGLDERTWNARRDRIAAAGVTEGLTINVDTALTVDSRNAHRLLKLAAATNLDMQDAWDLVYTAQFERNDDIGDWGVLRAIGSQIGLNDTDVTLLAETEQYSAAVIDDHREAEGRGIRSVPAVLVGSHRVSGDLAESVVELANLYRTAEHR